MNLDEYLWRNKISRVDFAKELEISRSHLQQILAGSRNASIKLARKIEEITGGKVTKEEVLFPEEYERKSE